MSLNELSHDSVASSLVSVHCLLLYNVLYSSRDGVTNLIDILSVVGYLVCMYQIIYTACRNY